MVALAIDLIPTLEILGFRRRVPHALPVCALARFHPLEVGRADREKERRKRAREL